MMCLFLICTISIWGGGEEGCEAIVHGIRATLDAHLDWVLFQIEIANAFNIVLRKAIFHELWGIGG
jgi:hypothetical protein